MILLHNKELHTRLGSKIELMSKGNKRLQCLPGKSQSLLNILFFYCKGDIDEYKKTI
jgi:hypothetical protein